MAKKELSWIFTLDTKVRDTLRLCVGKTGHYPQLSFFLSKGDFGVDHELRFNVLKYCMVEIEIRMKILTVRKQFGNLKLIY